MKNKIGFIHVGKEFDSPNIILLPIGVLALGDFLEKEGNSVEVVNFDMEKAIDPDFDLVLYIKNEKYNILCFDLHWHHQARRVIDVIRNVKEHNKSVTVVLGGFTASYFAEEIMKEFLFVDFLIRGDSEVPLLELADAIERKDEAFESIPNLTWRKDEKVICNEQKYVANKSSLKGMSYTNFKLLRNYDKYLQIIDEHQDRVGGENLKIFYYNCGRGCSANCSFCGGSLISQEIINKRKEVLFLDQEAVMKDLGRLKDYGVSLWCTSFDPTVDKKYYIELFRKIRGQKITLDVYFECWSLPTKEFIDEFKKTFGKRSKIVISPECGSEDVRRKNKGYYFSNNELVNVLKLILEKDISCEISFSCGLSSERREDIMKTLTLINFIRNKFKKVKIVCSAIEMEPASPWYHDPEGYGIVTSRASFMDFYRIHQKKSSIGYRTEYFSEEEIKEISRLYNIEVKCKKRIAEFLRTLSETLFAVGYYDLGDVFSLCMKCKYYEDCKKTK